MGETGPPKKSYPLLSLSKKLISTPPSHNDYIKATPPALGKKSLPIDSVIPGLLVGFLPPVQKSLQMTLRRMSKSHLKSHQNHWTLSLCRLELGDSSSSTASLALRFPRAWVRTRSINSALLPLILRPFCFRYIFSSLLVSAITSFTCFIYHTLNLYCY